jgi:hypothetical protein
MKALNSSIHPGRRTPNGTAALSLMTKLLPRAFDYAVFVLNSPNVALANSFSSK